MTEPDGTEDQTGSGQPAESNPSEPNSEEASEFSERDRDRSPDEELLERVKQADPAELAREIEALREQVAEAESERDELASEVEDLEDRAKRIQADFQNYKRRAEERTEQAATRATRDLVSSLLPVRDSLARAVEQDADADIRDGVEATLREFDDALTEAGLTAIEPDVGDEVDPNRHEVVHREDDDGNRIASVFRTGYELDETVIRPAQVTVGEVDTDEGS